MRGSNITTKTRARRLRRDATEVKRRLWHVLRNRQIEGRKFVRQMPIGPFFADFACRESKLVVELDGAQHAISMTDASRTVYLNQRGYRVLRFWNADVIDNIEGVVATIIDTLRGASPPDGAPHPPTAAPWAPPSPR
jgi:very-short-patch-repair endonuclease